MHIWYIAQRLQQPHRRARQAPPGPCAWRATALEKATMALVRGASTRRTRSPAVVRRRTFSDSTQRSAPWRIFCGMRLRHSRGLGSKHHAAARQVRGPCAPLTGATSALLAIRLLAAAGNFTAGQRLHRPLALIGQIGHHGLMHQRRVLGGIKYPVAQVER